MNSIPIIITLEGTEEIKTEKMKVKNDHRHIFSNLSNWKEEA